MLRTQSAVIRDAISRATLCSRNKRSLTRRRLRRTALDVQYSRLLDTLVSRVYSLTILAKLKTCRSDCAADRLMIIAAPRTWNRRASRSGLRGLA